MLVLGFLVLAGGAAIAAAATGRLPVLRKTWGTVASAVNSAVGSAVAPLSSAAAADSPADAGAEASAMPHRQTAPLSSAQLGAPLVHGGFVSACGAPDNMKVVIKADVRLGRAVTVNVKTNPPNLAVSSCIEQSTRDLQWDVSPKTGHVTVRY